MTVNVVDENSIDNMEFSDIDLSGTLSSTHKSEHRLTADKLLDELPLPQHEQISYLNHPLSPPPRNNYDQFFEEVSLDLPRDSLQDTTNSNSSPSRLMKFIPRKGTNNKSSRKSNSIERNSFNEDSMKITSLDISGPFYSISDVLDDSISSAPQLSRSTSLKVSNPRAARRNVNEAEVIVTSGGTSLPVKGRSSLNIFRRSKSISHKPSPLETVVSKTRPRMLPPKDPQEEKKHLQQYAAMMKTAKKLEAKKQKEIDRKKEEKDKKINHAVHMWENDIIPNWKSKQQDKKTQALWAQGIPPRCRKRIWMLRIGNDLNISKGTFTECVRRMPPSLRASNSASVKKHRVKDIAHDDSIYSSYRRQRRTSSLDVLRENNEEHLGVVEEDEDQFKNVSLAESLNNDKSYPNLSNQSDRSQDIDEDDGNIGLEDDSGDDDDDDSTSQEEEEDRDIIDNDDKDPTIINFLNKAIDDDILRTLPSLCVFQPDGPLFISLRRVLHAYVGYRPSMTYSRGASFLAGVLLLNMNTQDAFTSLINLISQSQVLSALYNTDEKKIKGYFKIFNVVFAENLPKLYLHFKNLTLTPENYLPDWFMTIFASIIPLELSSRLWDIYLLYGDIILFRTGVVVLKYLEPLLWGGGFSETVKILNKGFVGEHRGEEVKAALAVSGNIVEGGEDPFFDEILGRKGVYLDEARFNELLNAHMPRST